MTIEYYTVSKLPSRHPPWFVAGARVKSFSFKGEVLGFCESQIEGIPEEAVIKSNNGVYVITEMTSDYSEDKG